MEKKMKKNLLDKMKDYKYGMYGMDNIKFSKVGELIGIDEFYSGEGKVGICNEQNSYFAKENADLNFIKVRGREPKYFRSKQDNHYFLLTTSKKLPKNFYSIPLESQKRILNNLNPYVVDSSFKVVDNFNNSGYKIDLILDKFPLFKDSVFANGILRPLGIKSDGDLLYLGMQNNEFRIFSQELKTASLSKGIPLEKLSGLASTLKGNPELGMLVSRLSNAYINFKFSN